MAKVGRTYIGIKGTSAETIARGFGTHLARRAVFRPVIKGKEVEAELEGDRRKGQEFPNTKATFDPDEGTSLMGTPVYGTLEIERPKYSEFIYNKKKGEYEEKEVDLPKGTFLDEKDDGSVVDYFRLEGCVLEVTQDRNIVTTSISGQDGTDKEFINNGDYSVKLNGFVATDSPDVYPAADVKTLKAYFTAPVPLTVNNEFLNNYFNVSSLVVTKFDFKQVKGMRNVQYFTVDFISDVPFQTIEMDNV